MVKLLTVFLTLVIALSFGGLTFADSLGGHSAIEKTFPLSADGDTDDQGGEGDGQKMDDDDDEEEGGK